MSKAKDAALVEAAEYQLLIEVELELEQQGIVATEPMAVVEKRKRLEAKGWRAWYGEIFGMSFINALEDWHAEAIEWHWDSRMAMRRGEID